MKSNNIELVTEFDSKGNPLNRETFVTRPTVKLSLVYECVSFLSSLNETPSINEIQMMLDLVVRIYDEQFTKSQLEQGIESYKAMPILLEQIIFIASGQNVDEEIKDESAKKETVNSWTEYKNNLRATIQDIMKEGNQDVNSILDMPFYFVFDELNKEARKTNHKESMLDAFM